MSKVYSFKSKCHKCPICNGYGCINELPGMGGFSDNINFQNNVAGWNKVASEYHLAQSTLPDYEVGILNSPNLHDLPIRLGPMTGGIENVGYEIEEHFYSDLIEFASSLDINLSIGDGCPDTKLQYGIQAVRKNMETYPHKKAAVFIKPYPNEKILQRISWATDVASHIGIDIDSYNILTMRNQVKLEKKSDYQLIEIKKACDKPFILKGIFTTDDIELVKKVKPDVAFISNHGGRVENRIGSTAEFLAEYASTLKNFCGEIWVDGGIRTENDVRIAMALGANQVIIGRPVISAMS